MGRSIWFGDLHNRNSRGPAPFAGQLSRAQTTGRHPGCSRRAGRL